jgi:putative resolvase
MKVSIKKAAEELGVHQETLRRWEAAGKITVERTAKGHRRYDLASLKGVKPIVIHEQSTICYARVSSWKLSQCFQPDYMAQEAEKIKSYSMH